MYFAFCVLFSEPLRARCRRTKYAQKVVRCDMVLIKEKFVEKKYSGMVGMYALRILQYATYHYIHYLRQVARCNSHTKSMCWYVVVRS